MRILVYDVAASSGGALTVLNSFYEEFCKDTKNEYIFVLSVCELKEQPHIKVLNFPWIKKSPLHRMYFDQVLAHKLVKKYHADKVLSLQNMPFHSLNISSGRRRHFVHGTVSRSLDG